MVWKVVKSAQPPVRYRPNSDRRPDIVVHAGCQCAPNRIEADKQCSITDSHGVMVAALSAQEKL